MSQAGAVLLWETIRATGLAWGLCEELVRWRAVHDPGKVVADLAASVALGGDCLADVAMLRCAADVAHGVVTHPRSGRAAAWLS